MFTRITIPSKSEILKVDFRIIVNDTGSHYELKWFPTGSDLNKIESYTIFWCVSYDQMSYVCKDRLQYKVLDNNNVNKYIINKTNKDKLMTFAISANSKNSSTGIKRADCFSKPADGKHSLTLFICISL